ncbi:MAG: hypothetical protein ACOC93_03295, partial [Planctomycetota bacterium]
MNAENEQPGEKQTERTSPPRKPRRWRWWILAPVVVIVLAVLVALLPQLLSTPPGTAVLLGVANGRIRGTLAAEDLSLSWGGPIRADGLVLRDPAGRPVLTAEQTSISKGLWGLVRGGGGLSRIQILSPDLTLQLKPEGGTTLQDAIASPEPAEPAAPPAEEPGGPQATIVVTDGSGRVIQPDGRTLEIGALSGELSIDTLQRIAGQAEADLADGRVLLN